MFKLKSYERSSLAISFLLIFVFIGNSCSKTDSSSNIISYSLDGGTKRNCSEKSATNEILGGSNCEFSFSREGHFMFGEYANIALYVDTNCNLTSGELPYSTSDFTLVISDNNDTRMSPQISPYAYPDTNPVDSANGQISHLTLEITYRKNGRVKGNISGEIFGGDYHNPGLKNLICDFDLLIPFNN